MAKAEMIQSLERGLKVLKVVALNPTSSLQEIYAATGIPKPSLLRILNTLVHDGLVSRRLADGRYRFGAFTGVTRKPDHHDRIAEAAGPILDRLCRKVLWPSDLLVPMGDHMERRETSQSYSPFFPHRTQRNRVGQKVGWLLTGVGRAYLAFCPDKEREQILIKLRGSANPEDWLARQPKQLERILTEVRKRGYATRDFSFIGGHYGEPPTDDGLAAIAVPLRDRNRVHGSVNILWIRSAFTVEEFAARHLAELQTAAADIVGALRPGVGTKPFANRSG